MRRREERREERRSRRIHVSGEGMHVHGVDIDGMGFGDFAKGFMKDFVSDAGGDQYRPGYGFGDPNHTHYGPPGQGNTNPCTGSGPGNSGH